MNKQIIQITSGKGPLECKRVVFLVLRELIKTCKTLQLLLKEVELVETDIKNCYESVTLIVEGQNLDQLQQAWAGSIQWIAKSPFRKEHKRKNWFVGIQFYSFKELQVIEEKDIKYEFLRIGGPGGQHVNKVETAVRATHLPTQLSAVSNKERSQLQNRKTAKQKLQVNLLVQNQAEEKKQTQQQWLQHHQLERGNPIKTFKQSMD